MASARPPVLRTYRPSDHDALLSLWSRCGLLRPWNDPRRDIQRKLAHDLDGLLVLEIGERLAGTVMAGYDGHRGWVNYLAVDPACQGQGLGRLPEDQPAGKKLQRGRRRLLPAPRLSRRRRGEHGQAPDRRRRPAVVAELRASTPGRPEGAPDTRDLDRPERASRTSSSGVRTVALLPGRGEH